MNKHIRRTIAGLSIVMLASLYLISVGVAAAHEGHSHAPASAKKLKNPVAATEENIAAGRALYTPHCATCHGEDGKAKTDMASTMKVKPTDLTSHAMHGLTEGEVYWVITNGIKKGGMPLFKAKMNDRERWQTTLYVRRLAGLHMQGTPRRRDEHAGHNMPAAEMPAAHQHIDQTDQKQGADQTAPGKQDSMRRQGHTMPSQTQPTEQPANGDAHKGHAMPADHNMAAMDAERAGHNMMNMTSTVTGGPFHSMQAIGSGTSLQPASTTMSAWHFMPDDWMLMVHGNLAITYNQQGGPRGVGKAESMNWLMVMAEHDAGPGRLMLRGMFSAEPLTTPHGGFPLLFQTGETYHGRPDIDAQHPHNLFMELAASYTVPLAEKVSFQIYGGPVAEPALGPVAFMHRASASENPAAPIGHHWQDSTHITFGVVTGALTAGPIKVEVSGFHGAEPGENRAGIQLGKLDSYSFRTWFIPTQNWAMQFSYGHLTKPETLELGDLDRMTASVAYNRPFTKGSWASTLVWGRNSEAHSDSNSYLLESTVNFLRKDHLYTRLELIDKNSLLLDNIFGRRGLARPPVLMKDDRNFNLPPEFDRWFRVGAFTFGGVRDFVDTQMLRVGLGSDVTFYHKPGALDQIYGKRPTSFHVFLRFRPGDLH